MNSAMQQSYPQHFSGKIHLVGIGGAGMSGIAEVLVNLGYRVQGSDLADSPTMEYLRSLGIKTFVGHDASHVRDANVVVTSAAIDADNPEVRAAAALRCPILKRAEMLAELMRFRLGIAVAGTHGKTTTTSLIATILSNVGMDPTYVVGGKVSGFGKRASLGQGQYLVLEADESDASFLYLNPVIAVITNIDRDHLENYNDCFSTLQESFAKFMKRIPFYGAIVVWKEDVHIQSLRQDVPRRFVTYGFTPDCDIYATEIQINQFSGRCQVHAAWSEQTYAMHLNLPGRHNMLNTLAALAVAHEVGIGLPDAIAALESFQGIERRFQSYGEIETPRGNILLIDDYGHHPSEIRETYQTACVAWPQRRKVLVFQPHRYSRLKNLFHEFSEVLVPVDVLVLLDTYPAGEKPLDGFNTKTLCENIQALGGRPIHLENLQDVIPALADEEQGILAADDVLIMMGAGSIGTVARQFSQAMEFKSVTAGCH